MLVTDFAALVRTYTGTNTSTLTDAEIRLIANGQIEQLASYIAKAVP